MYIDNPHFFLYNMLSGAYIKNHFYYCGLKDEKKWRYVDLFH